MITLYCKRCGGAVEVTDIEIIDRLRKRYYVYCFECDIEYSFTRRERTNM